MPLATDRPTRSEPTRPGPRVTAMPSMRPRSMSARASAASITGSRLVRCCRDASSGTTPPNGPWTASCEDTTEARSRPSSRTAAAESSHEVSMPRTITSSFAGPDREEDGVVAATHEEEHALPLAARLHRLLVLRGVVHRAAIRLGDHVAAPQPRLGGRPVRLHFGHHDASDALVQTQVLGDLGRERLHAQTQLLAAGAATAARLAVLAFVELA